MPQLTYIESRLPSASSNPYLVLAATVTCGIDGINNNLPCPSPISPVTAVDNTYREVTPTKVPLTLGEALEALQADHYIVNSLGRDFITWFVMLKKGEVSFVSGCDGNNDEEEKFAKERELYMDLI
jgi:glutamine synthetase